MIGLHIPRRAPRRGTSLLEMGIAIVTMLVVVLSVWVIATGFWSKAVMESTAAVASLNAQSAYNRIRFAPGINDARNALADTEARRAANTVINLSMTNAQAGLMGITADPAGRCTIPGPATTNTGVTNPSYINDRIRRQIDIASVTPAGNDVRVTVTTRALWNPMFLPRALFGDANIGSGCVAGRGVAIARKP